MNSIPKLKKLIELLLEEDYRGSQAKYIERNKLTSYYVNQETNYIPPKMLTPIMNLFILQTILKNLKSNII